MTSLPLSDFLPLVKEAAIHAGEAILQVYHSSNFQVQFKTDHSPLTLADQQANTIITEALAATNLPVLSEEGKEIPYSERKDWKCFWLVDPLDGTKEFIKRNGEFTVNIALIYHNQPVLGVIHAPVLHETYWAIQGKGAFAESKETDAYRMQALSFSMGQNPMKVVGSRSHSNQKTQDYLNSLLGYQLFGMGSSLKFMLLAKGEAHMYPRTGPTMEWDTAAAHIILKEAGGNIVTFEGKEELTYNKENLLNPEFLAFGKLEK